MGAVAPLLRSPEAITEGWLTQQGCIFETANNTVELDAPERLEPYRDAIAQAIRTRMAYWHPWLPTAYQLSFRKGCCERCGDPLDPARSVCWLCLAARAKAIRVPAYFSPQVLTPQEHAEAFGARDRAMQAYACTLRAQDWNQPGLPAAPWQTSPGGSADSQKGPG